MTVHSQTTDSYGDGKWLARTPAASEGSKRSFEATFAEGMGKKEQSISEDLVMKSCDFFEEPDRYRSSIRRPQSEYKQDIFLD